MKSFVVYCLCFVAVFAHAPFESVDHRIANGQVALPKQFPYQARLQFTKRKNGKFVSSLCGGALISNKTILTAAHCVENAVSVMIFLGTTKSLSNEPTRVMRGSWASRGEFIAHKNFNGTSMENDIALVTTTQAIQFNDAIRPVNLPKFNQMNLENRMAVIAGFGKTGTKAPVSNELRFANRRILSNLLCQRPYPAYFKPNMHLCIDGSQNISTCPGDSGGPLVIQEADESKTVVGLTSFGGISCDTGYPVVFTKVSNYINWIQKHMI
uniref:Venom polypeptide n=1 Tax=Dolopus genitalis TaxID=2488630 RepID=A0A3G5BII1_DOLGE|nr:venom polypeptide [Dolopus genitalis]